MKVYTEYVETPESHNCNLSGFYLHGFAEEKAGFDCVSWTSCSVNLDVGVHPIDVVFEDGTTECLLFVYACPYRGKQGLIVFKEDVDSIQYATLKFIQKDEVTL